MSEAGQKSAYAHCCVAFYQTAGGGPTANNYNWLVLCMIAVT